MQCIRYQRWHRVGNVPRPLFLVCATRMIMITHVQRLCAHANRAVVQRQFVRILAGARWLIPVSTQHRFFLNGSIFKPFENTVHVGVLSDVWEWSVLRAYFRGVANGLVGWNRFIGTTEIKVGKKRRKMECKITRVTPTHWITLFPDQQQARVSSQGVLRSRWFHSTNIGLTSCRVCF